MQILDLLAVLFFVFVVFWCFRDWQKAKLYREERQDVANTHERYLHDCNVRSELLWLIIMSVNGLWVVLHFGGKYL